MDKPDNLNLYVYIKTISEKGNFKYGDIAEIFWYGEESQYELYEYGDIYKDNEYVGWDRPEILKKEFILLSDMRESKLKSVLNS